jgi:hypothetical protein
LNLFIFGRLYDKKQFQAGRKYYGKVEGKNGKLVPVLN